MTRAAQITHLFVDHIPQKLEEGTLYISIPLATAMHRCLCGCGTEIATPLTPTDWQLTFDGDSVSLSPSVGNWSLPCRSHYWIERNRVLWSYAMSPREIAAGRAADRGAKARYYSGAPPHGDVPAATPAPAWNGLLRRLGRLFQASRDDGRGGVAR